MSPCMQGQRWSQLRAVVQPTDWRHIWTRPPSLRMCRRAWESPGVCGACAGRPPLRGPSGETHLNLASGRMLVFWETSQLIFKTPFPAFRIYVQAVAADDNRNREKDLTKTRWFWARTLAWSLFGKTTRFPCDEHSASQRGGSAPGDIWQHLRHLL